MIPRKLYDRMVDLELEVLKAVDDRVREKVDRLDDELTKLQEELDWPWKASQEQLDDWNSRRRP